MMPAQKHLARDLSPEERLVVEKLLGKPLADAASVEIRSVTASDTRAESVERTRRLSDVHNARIAVSEHTQHLTEADLDEILDDRPITAEPGADRR